MPQENNHPIRIRRYKKNNLIARYCQVLLKRTAYPSLDELSRLQLAITSAFEKEFGSSVPLPSASSLRSQIKEWFRKRREYMSFKIYSVCDKMMEGWWEAALAELDDNQQGIAVTYAQVVQFIVYSDEHIEVLRQLARLPITNPDMSKAFIRKRVEDYFYKICEPKFTMP